MMMRDMRVIVVLYWMPWNALVSRGHHSDLACSRRVAERRGMSPPRASGRTLPILPPADAAAGNYAHPLSGNKLLQTGIPWGSIK